MTDDGAADTTPTKPRRRVVFVTGLSGAGLSSALKVMEDFGYEVFDHFPLHHIMPLLDEQGFEDSPLAFCLDTRSRGFNPTSILALRDRLRQKADTDVHILFLTSSNAVLQKRFSETRRSHPLAKDRPVVDGIMQERAWLKPLLDQADLVVDTSELRVHDLRRTIESSIHPDPAKNKLSITLLSFGFKNGIPREADMVLDARFLNNPHWVPALKALTGLDAPVQTYIDSDAGFAPFLVQTEGLLDLLLPRYAGEGKYYFTLAVGCTGGQHRSVYLVARLSQWLEEKGYAHTVRHRDLETK